MSDLDAALYVVFLFLLLVSFVSFVADQLRKKKNKRVEITNENFEAAFPDNDEIVLKLAKQVHIHSIGQQLGVLASVDIQEDGSAKMSSDEVARRRTITEMTWDDLDDFKKETRIRIAKHYLRLMFVGRVVGDDG